MTENLHDKYFDQLLELWQLHGLSEDKFYSVTEKIVNEIQSILKRVDKINNIEELWKEYSIVMMDYKEDNDFLSSLRIILLEFEDGVDMVQDSRNKYKALYKKRKNAEFKKNKSSSDYDKLIEITERVDSGIQNFHDKLSESHRHLSKIKRSQAKNSKSFSRKIERKLFLNKLYIKLQSHTIDLLVGFGIFSLIAGYVLGVISNVFIYIVCLLVLHFLYKYKIAQIVEAYILKIEKRRVKEDINYAFNFIWSNKLKLIQHKDSMEKSFTELQESIREKNI